MGVHFLSFFVGLDFLAFWLFGGQLLGPPTSCQKWSVFLISYTKALAAPGPAPFSKFWPFGPSFLFILASWAFISFILALWAKIAFVLACGPSFPCILAIWACISFHFGLRPSLQVAILFPFRPPWPGGAGGCQPPANPNRKNLSWARTFAGIAKLTYYCLNLRFKFDIFAAKISSPSCAYLQPKRDTDATR